MSRGKPRQFTSEEITAQAAAVARAMRRAVRQAIIEHKQSGDPIVVCDDGGKVRWIPADEIVIPELEPE